MKKLLVLSLICFLSGLFLVACQRDQGVQAGNEQGRTDTYQPRPAPKEQATEQNKNYSGAQQQEVRGELVRVDMTKKTMMVRTENGLEQTFKWDETTQVEGVDQSATNNTRTGKQAASNHIRSLMGKEGSEVTVNWKDENGAKMATSINVTQASSKATNSKTGTSKNKAKKNTY
ncbi:MAG TPA: hypothetical protein VE422_41675 [Terriglobia bacterium]|nr:hypothetical protein [Terriglobia bacterium]